MENTVDVTITPYLDEKGDVQLDFHGAGFDLSCATPTYWVDGEARARILVPDFEDGSTRYKVEVRPKGARTPWDRASACSASEPVAEADFNLELLATPDGGSTGSAPGGAAIKIKRRGHGG